MGFEKRRANITFKAADCVQITNIFFQKTFYLKKECIVDLFKLKISDFGEDELYDDVKHAFFVCFREHKCDEWCEDSQCFGQHWYGEVVLKTSKEDLEILDSQEDTVTLKNNNINYNGAVWVDE